VQPGTKVNCFRPAVRPNLDAPDNCDLVLRNFDVFFAIAQFLWQSTILAQLWHNFRAALPTFVNFEAASIQTLTVVSCDH